MKSASSSGNSRFVGLQRTLVLIADLLAGKEVDRESAVRRTGLKPAAVDRQLRAIQKHVPGVVKMPGKRRLTLRFDKSRLEEAPSFPIAVAACFGASLSKLFEGSSYESGIAAALSYVVQRTRHRKVFRDIERKFFFVRQGGEVSLPSNATVLDELIEGILKQKQCLISYLPFEDVIAINELIDPLSIAIYDHQLYIIGRSSTRVRCYRFSRIREAEVTMTGFEYPSRTEFDPEQLFGSSFGIFISSDFAMENIRIKLALRWKNYALTHRWHRSQKVDVTNDGVIINLHSRVCPELQQWILSFGAEAEVLEPSRLRSDIAAHIIKMARLYAERPS